VLRRTGSRLGAKAGDREGTRSAGVLSLEPWEPRLLLSADLAGMQPPLCTEISCPVSAIHVDLGQQEDPVRENLTPVLSLVWLGNHVLWTWSASEALPDDAACATPRLPLGASGQPLPGG